jgi:hypothetical protein
LYVIPLKLGDFMKIIEGLKKIKDLQRKASDYRELVKNHCADLDCETPIYPDQKKQVSEWLQGYGDITKEILSLRYRIQKTNLETPVTIQLGDKFVTKSIAEWIHRRKDLADLDAQVWKCLSDRGLKETSFYQLTPQAPQTQVKRRLYFDAAERDKKLELYRSEPSIIDSTLEVINAVTDLKD